jgi:hypothetical protein
VALAAFIAVLIVGAVIIAIGIEYQKGDGTNKNRVGAILFDLGALAVMVAAFIFFG